MLKNYSISFSMFDQYTLSFPRDTLYQLLDVPYLHEVLEKCEMMVVQSVYYLVILNLFLSLNNLLISWYSCCFHAYYCLLSEYFFSLLMFLIAPCISVISNSFKVTLLFSCCSSVMRLLVELTEHNHIGVCCNIN